VSERCSTTSTIFRPAYLVKWILVANAIALPHPRWVRVVQLTAILIFLVSWEEVWKRLRLVKARKNLLCGALLVELVVHVEQATVLALFQHAARHLGRQMSAIDIDTAIVEVTAPDDVVELLGQMEVALAELCAESLAQFAVLLPALLILV